MPYFRECPYCHCHLDPGEPCDCPESRGGVLQTQPPAPPPVPPRRASPYERTRAAVHATGNRWAIENFEATH